LWRSYLPWISTLALLLVPFIFSSVQLTLAKNREEFHLIFVQILAYMMIVQWALVIPYFTTHSLFHLKSSGVYEIFFSQRRSSTRIVLSTLLPIGLFIALQLFFFSIFAHFLGGISLGLIFDQIISLSFGGIFVLSFSTIISLLFSPLLATMLTTLLYFLMVSSTSILQHWVYQSHQGFFILLWRGVPRFDLFHQMNPLLYQGDRMSSLFLESLFLQSFGGVLLAFVVIHFFFKPSLK
ncbi:MAG: hypothetical protein V4507_06765, partial [Verrucomicrobiota bacterium]